MSRTLLREKLALLKKSDVLPVGVGTRSQPAAPQSQRRHPEPHTPNANPSGPQPSSRLQGEVFSINFIRRETLALRIRRSLVYVGLGYLALHAAIMLWLLASAVLAHHQSQRMQRLLHSRSPSVASPAGVSQQEMESLRDRAAADLAMLNAMATLQQQRFFIGPKVAGLARTLPARTWITNLTGHRQGRSLTIQAAYLVNPETPYELPAKEWMAALKDDAGFGPGLQRLELGSTSRKMQGMADLYYFELSAEWQP